MVLFLALCILATALLLMPDVFEGLWQTGLDHPAQAFVLVAVMALVGVWVYRR